MESKILGHSTSFPVYITATALAKLADKEGEVAITKAAYTENVIQMCPTLASCSLEEMTSARQSNQVQFFQLYVNKDRNITANLIHKAEAQGCKAIFITVDAPALGTRKKTCATNLLLHLQVYKRDNRLFAIKGQLVQFLLLLTQR